MKTIFQLFLFVTLIFAGINSINAQSGNSSNINEQTDLISPFDQNFITFKLNCNTTNCGFQIVNSLNQPVAYFLGDGSHAFYTYTDYIDWMWKYNSNILFDIHADPIYQRIYSYRPLIINTNSDTLFGVIYNNQLVFGCGKDPNQNAGCYFSGSTVFNGNGLTESVHIQGNGAPYALRVTGSACSTVGWSICSDARLKKSIVIISNALNRLLSLKGVTFNWRKDEFPEYNFENGNNIGFIAQDMEKVFPEIVNTGPDGYKSIDYAKLTPVIVESIKEQQRIIESQKVQIHNQEQEIKILRQELNNQKKDIENIYSIINKR